MCDPLKLAPPPQSSEIVQSFTAMFKAHREDTIGLIAL